jgi:hypothetical protein
VFNSCCDRFQNTLPIRHNVVIVEAQYPKSLAGQKGIPPRITLLVFRFKMLPSVELDHEIRRMADKVHYVRTNRRLATKACAVQPMAA